MHAHINGHRAWYDVVGNDGPPVLLIMGFGMPGRVWAPQVRGLSKGHRVAYYDNRGVGGSELKPGPAYTVKDLAKDAVGILDAASFEDAHVVGVSMGGMIAQELALNHRKRVRSLALIATHAGGPGPHALPTTRGLRLFLKANTSKGLDRLKALRAMLFPPQIQPRIEADVELVRESAESLGKPADKGTMLKQLLAIARHDTNARLHQLDGLPTLIVKPALDVLVPPENSDRLHRLIPGSMMLSFSDAGHGVTTQSPLELNAHLATHFAHSDTRRRARAAA
jgi:3-oxoadipate enol-lactonase